jgi:hypothetical protein
MIDTIRSKKLWFSAGSLILVFVFALLTIRWPQLQSIFETFTNTAIAIAGLYLAGNVGNKFVAGRSEGKAPAAVKKVAEDGTED